MKIVKIIVSIYILFFIISCQNVTNKQDKQEQMINQNSPEYKAFMTQEHRFELNGCELKYNGKPFKLGMTLQEFESIFGKSDKEDIIKSRNEKRLIWVSKNISITFHNSKAIYLYIYI